MEVIVFINLSLTHHVSGRMLILEIQFDYFIANLRLLFDELSYLFFVPNLCIDIVMLTKPYLQYKIFVHCFILYILHCRTFNYTYKILKINFVEVQKKTILTDLN